MLFEPAHLYVIHFAVPVVENGAKDMMHTARHGDGGP